MKSFRVKDGALVFHLRFNEEAGSSVRVRFGDGEVHGYADIRYLLASPNNSSVELLRQLDPHLASVGNQVFAPFHELNGELVFYKGRLVEKSRNQRNHLSADPFFQRWAHIMGDVCGHYRIGVVELLEGESLNRSQL
eukprot:scaffold20024_cov14-Prasinocladus_malaysianus.AAC.1